MATSPADVPLSIEPVLGWRVWRLHRRRDGALQLRAVTRDDAWPPGEVMAARCPTHRGATLPSQGCSCGLYAASSPEDLAASGIFMRGVCVIGAVAMWGRVVEHTRGARSRFAYPARLRLACGPCLEAGAGVVDPIVVVGTGDALMARCRRHSGGDLVGRSTPAAQVQAELLAAYGVEVMPRERLARAVRTGSVVAPSIRRLRPLLAPLSVVGTILRLLLEGVFMLWACSGFILLALAIVGGAFQAVTQALGLRSPSPSPSVVIDPVVVESIVLTPEADPPRAGSRPPVSPPVWSFAVVCGSAAGQRLTLVRCGSPADALGFAVRGSPDGAAEDCAQGWDAYTRGPHYSICWSGHRARSHIPRRPHAPNPWSIPIQKGGAVR